MNTEPSFYDPSETFLKAVVGLETGVLKERQANAIVTDSAFVGLASPQGCSCLAELMSKMTECSDTHCAGIPLSANTRHLFATLLAAYADALQEANRPALSVTINDSVEPVFQAVGRPGALASCYLNRGRALIELGRYEDGIRDLSRAESHYTSRGIIALAATCQKYIAGGHLRNRRPVEALDGFMKAITTFLTVKSEDLGVVKACREEIARCQRTRGAIFSDQKKYREASEEFRKAALNFTDLGNHRMAASALVLRGQALSQVGKYNDALTDLAQAQAIYERLTDEVGIAECRSVRATPLRYLGRYQEALDEYAKAEPVYQAHGMLGELGIDQANRIEVLLQLGKYEESLQACLDYQIGSPITRAQVNVSKGNALSELNRWQEAADAYSESETFFTDNGFEIFAATCRLNRGAAFLTGELWDRALEDFREADLVFTKEGLVEQSAVCKINQIDALMGLKKYQAAAEVGDKIDKSQLTDEWICRCCQKYGKALWQSGKKSQALQQFTIGRVAARRAREIARIDETGLEYFRGRGLFIRTAVQCAIEAGDFKLAFDAVQDGKAGVLGDIRRRGNLSHYVNDSEINQARSHLGNWLRKEIHESWNSQVEKLLWAHEPEEKEAQEKLAKRLRQETRKRTNSLLGLWQRARQIDAGRAITPMTAEPIELEAIQAALPSNWAIIDFWDGHAGQLNVFIITKTSFSLDTVSLQWDDPKTDRAFSDLEKWHVSSAGERDHALDLFYDLIFAPLMPRLESYEGLYLVPHDLLHFIPLHACRDEAGRYLSDKFQISYLPSARLLPQLPRPAINAGMLTLANPDRRQRGTLPFSEWEADRLHSELGMSKHDIWCGNEARRSRLDCWDQYSILHFSCHGFGESRFAPLSRLILSDDVLFAYDIVNTLPALREGTLAVLNGCQTSVRDTRAMNEGLGLMSAFLLRGAGAVLATQWNVMDYCAAEIVVTFLKEAVVCGMPLGRAIQLAYTRARSITAREVEARCQDMILKKFPAAAYPYENARLNSEAMHACLKAGRAEEAKHYANNAARSLRSLGLLRESKQIEGIPISASCMDPDPDALIYDHPVFWSAFQLTGRIT